VYKRAFFLKKNLKHNAVAATVDDRQFSTIVLTRLWKVIAFSRHFTSFQTTHHPATQNSLDQLGTSISVQHSWQSISVSCAQLVMRFEQLNEREIFGIFHSVTD